MSTGAGLGMGLFLSEAESSPAAAVADRPRRGRSDIGPSRPRKSHSRWRLCWTWHFNCWLFSF